MSDFVKWLNGEMKTRGWGNNELARRMGVSNAIVSLVLTEQQNPGIDFCLGLSRAFKIPPETAFRKSGIFPQVTEDKEAETQLVECFRYLSPTIQRLILAQIRAAYEIKNEDK